MAKISRRRFLQVSTAAVAGTLVVPHHLYPAQENQQADVVVIGAGLSGLVAARNLVKAGIASVVVLEAQDRVGGRTFDLPLGSGGIVEGGGQFIGPMQDRVIALAKELGVSTFKAHPGGSDLYYLGGKPSRTPTYSLDAYSQYDKAAKQINALSATVPLAEPWKAEKAEEWDNMSFGDYLDKEGVTNPQARSIYNLIMFSSLNALPEELSLLYVLFYVHSGINLDVLITATGGAQDSRFVGGPQSLSLKMASELGSKVLVNSPVTQISETSGGLLQVVSGKITITAKKVIVAMMPSLIKKVTFSPALPQLKQGLVNSWPTSGDLKVNVVYKTPFWRANGLSGSISHSELPAASFVYDNTPPDKSVGILVTWPDWQRDPKLKEPEQRKQEVLNAFAAYFGNEALNPVSYIETNWAADQWSPSCVSPVGKGVLTKYGTALREPTGNIHWAGTETSDKWNGFLDGAVRAGERVAAEVKDALAKAK